MPLGRPSPYKPEYCDLLVKHMSEGLSFESFGAEVDVCKDTLYEWAKQHPEFSYAKKKGTERCRAYYERAGRDGMNAKIPFFNDRIWRLNMINRFRDEWIDSTSSKQEVKAEVTQNIKVTMHIDDGGNVQPPAPDGLPEANH